MSSQTLPAPAKQLFSDLFEQASLGIAVENLEGRILLANPALCSMLGYEEHELCAMSCSQFAKPEDSEDDWAHFQQLRAGLIDQYSLEKRYVRKDGAQIWAHLNVSLSKNTDDGSPLVFAFLEEITARKLADQELVATNQQLRLALEASTSVSWEWDVRSGRTSRFGDLQNMYGIDADRFVGHVDEFRRYVHPEDRQMVEQEITDARKSRKPYASEFRIVRADGAVRWMSARGSFHYSKEGEAERMLGIATDITERKQTEERLREYEKAVEGSEEIIAVIDRDYRYLIANRKFLDIRKQLKEDVVGHLVSEVLDKKLFETVIKHKMDQCFAGEVVTYELRYPYPEIGERDLFVSYFPIEGAAGVDRVVCVLQDITERKKSLEALRTSEERFRLAAQAGKMYAYEWDVAADIVIRSDDYVSVLGYKDQVERLTRQQIINRVHPDDRATFVDNLDQMTPVNPRSQISYRILRPDGSSLWVEKSQRGFFDEQGKLLRIIGIVADITERKQGEQALQRSEANYRLFVSQSSEGIFCQALDRPIPVDLPEDEQIKRILYESYMAECNDSLAKMYGAATKDLVGKRLAETLDVNNPTNIELTREYIRGGYRVVDRESHESDPQGNRKVFLNSMIGVVENGMLVRTWGIQRDITDSRRAEEDRLRVEQALRESEERFRLAAQIGKMYAYEWDAKTDRIVRSGAQASMLGLKDEGQQLTRQDLLSAIHIDDREMFISSLERLTPENPQSQVSYRVLRPDGSVVWLDKSQQAFFDEQRKISRVIGVVTDITDRKQAEEAVRQKEEALMEAQRLAGVGSWQWDSAADSVVWSKEMYRLMGIDPYLPAPSFKEHEQLFTTESWERLRSAVEAALQTGTPYELELEVISPKSAAKWEIARGEPLRDSSGQIIGLHGTVQDITERRRAEEGIKKSEEKFSKAFRRSPMALTLTSARDHRYIDVNETFEQITGWRRHEIVGRTSIDIGLLSEAERTEITTRLFAEQSLRNAELQFRMRDGSIRIGLSSAELIDLDGEPCVLAVTADITDRKRTQEALRESEDKLRLLLDSTAEAIYGIDLEHRCTFCNPACVRTLGYESVDQVLGKNMHYLMHHSRPDGTPFPIDACRVHRVIQNGEGVHAEDEVFWRANKTSFPAEYWSYPQRRGQELIGSVVTFTDISERKAAELALASVSRKLIEAQEQERTRIARELHDDIGQRLGMLAVEIEELRQGSSDFPAAHRGRVAELWKLTSEIATDVQSLSHELHSAKLEYLGILAAIRAFCRDFGEQHKIQVNFRAHDLPSPIPAEVSVCLFRVLQEALHNSAKYSGVKHSEVRLWGTSDELHLTISDSGEGFDREIAKASRGLGLISMEERLKLVSGTLSIESQPKRGTIIHARVPLKSDAPLMQAAG